MQLETLVGANHDPSLVNNHNFSLDVITSAKTRYTARGMMTAETRFRVPLLGCRPDVVPFAGNQWIQNRISGNRMPNNCVNKD